MARPAIFTTCLLALLLALPAGTATAAPAAPAAIAPGVLLIASPELSDPNFEHTVVLITRHDEGGTMGVILNRPTRTPLRELLPGVEGLEDYARNVNVGGPVARGQVVLLIRAEDPPQGAEPVFEGVYFGIRPHTLTEMLARPDAERALRAYAGYAGWAPGQLAAELERGSWHLWPAEEEQVFDADPLLIWQDLLRLARGKWTLRAAAGVRG